MRGPKDRRSALVVDENSVSIVLHPLKLLLDQLNVFGEFFQGTRPLFCHADLRESGSLPFRAMRFNCYTLPIVPLLTSSPVLVILSCPIATIS